ncbi:hypothetical protein AM598_08425 [Paenibacillus polymyxa]|nr:hypothetical protein AM598_08425 [Paenibacillus polymyxa]
MTIKNLFLIFVVLVVGLCSCFMYAIHKDKNPSVSGSVGPVQIRMTVEPSDDAPTQHGKDGLP